MHSIDSHHVENINKRVKKPKLPSLIRYNNKKEKIQSRKLPKLQNFRVAQSDLDSIVSPNICFCSIKSELSDINSISYSSKMKDKENIIDVSKKFDLNRPNEFCSLFIEKCQKCKMIIDCYHESKNDQILYKLMKDKENKKKLLIQLNDALRYPSLVRKITANEVRLIIELFSKNIFRSYPPISYFPPSILFDRVESFHDDAWDQIFEVYSFFISFVTSTYIDPKMLNNELSLSFIKNLFSCFLSPDGRERKQVLEVLYIIACRFPEKCNNIFELIINKLIDSIYTKSNQWGLSQILELLSKMMTSIPQFSLSLRDNFLSKSESLNENLNDNSNSTSILEQAFLHLHQLPSFPSFSSNLYACINYYLQIQNTEKSTHLVEKILLYFLNHYPVASQKKQIIILNEIQQIISNFSKVIFPSVAVKLMTFIGRNLFISPCVEISEKSMSFVFEDCFSTLINQYYSQIVPVFYVSSLEVSKNHHDDSIRGLAIAVLQELSRINHRLFNDIVMQINKESKQESFFDSEKNKTKINDEIVFDFKVKSKSKNDNNSISRLDKWEMIKEAAKLNKNVIDNKNGSSYNNENGNENIMKSNKMGDFDLSFNSNKVNCKNIRLSYSQSSSQNNSKIILNSFSFDASRPNNVDFSKPANINCSKSINLKQGQLFKSQNNLDVERKMMKSQPLSTAMINMNKSSSTKSPRAKNKGILKLDSNNFKRHPSRR